MTKPKPLQPLQILKICLPWAVPDLAAQSCLDLCSRPVQVHTQAPPTVADITKSPVPAQFSQAISRAAQLLGSHNSQLVANNESPDSHLVERADGSQNYTPSSLADNFTSQPIDNTDSQSPSSTAATPSHCPPLPATQVLPPPIQVHPGELYIDLPPLPVEARIGDPSSLNVHPMITVKLKLTLALSVPDHQLQRNLVIFLQLSKVLFSSKL